MTKKRFGGKWRRRDDSSQCSSPAIERALEAQRLKANNNNSNNNNNNDNDHDNNNNNDNNDNVTNNNNNNEAKDIKGYIYEVATDRYYKVDNKKKTKVHNDNNSQITSHKPIMYNVVDILNSRELYRPSLIPKRLEYLRLSTMEFHINTDDNCVDHRTVNDTHSHDSHGMLIIRDHNDGIQLHLNIHQKVSLLRNNRELELSTEKYRSIDNVCWKPNTNDEMTLCFTNDHSHNHCGLIIGNLIESTNKKKIFIKDICKFTLENSKPVQQCLWSKYNNDNIFLLEEDRIKLCNLHSIKPSRYIMKVKTHPLKYITCSDANSLIIGFRNGKIFNYDTRCNDTNAASYIGSMNFAIDYTYCLRNSHDIIVQDILGSVNIFDQRKPNMVLQKIYQAKNENHFSTQMKRFWVSDNENVLATSHNTQINFYDIYSNESLLHSSQLTGIDLNYYNSITIASQAITNDEGMNKSYFSHLTGVIHSNNYNFQDQIWYAKQDR